MKTKAPTTTSIFRRHLQKFGIYLHKRHSGGAFRTARLGTKVNACTPTDERRCLLVSGISGRRRKGNEKCNACKKFVKVCKQN